MTKQFIFLLALTTLLIAACRGQQPYTEIFDEAGTWRVGEDPDVNGQVIDGVYQFEVSADVGTFWTTAGENFRNGLYSVEVTQTDGPIDAGYGLMLRVDDNNDSFYLFEISGDGYAWIGRCLAGCSEQTVLINDWWFETSAIKQGLGISNELKVEANAGNLLFFINDIEVGRVTDSILSQGDVGLFVETIGLGDVTIQFDNVRVSPLE
ncbi:MAG: hypothetical protein ACPG8W_05595 [Candidatus Promineifilaceae bacterium]